MKQKKVVITGMGVLAPNGNSVDDYWLAIKSGTSGIAPISYFDTSDHRVTIAGELKNFDPNQFIEKKEVRKLDPFSIYALSAAHEAVDSSSLNLKNINLDRAGVIIATGIGGIQTLENEHDIINNRGPRRVSPLFVSKMIPNIAGGHLSMK